MITVAHKIDSDGIHYCTATHSDFRTYGSCDYAIGWSKPNYPMPAIRYRTVSSLIKLGYVSALNEFDVEAVFQYFIEE